MPVRASAEPVDVAGGSERTGIDGRLGGGVIEGTVSAQATGGPIEGTARAAMREVFGRETVSTASGGSIPLLGTLQALAPDAEFVVWGAQEGQHSSAHGPDESQDLAELERMILAEARFLELLGETAR